MYFYYFLYKIPKNIYKDRSRTGLGTDLYTVLGPSNGPVQSSPGQKTGLLGPGPDRTGPIHLYNRPIINESITTTLPTFIRTGDTYFHEKELHVNAMISSYEL